MANTINGTTDEALLRSIIDGSIEEFEDDMVTTIQAYKFYGCTELERVDCENVTSVGGSGVFVNCTSLESANFPKLTAISGFQGCSSLKDINFPVATSIENYGFTNCASITELYLPNITQIGNGSCQGMTSLKQAFFPNLTRFPTGNAQFSYDTNLKVIDLGSVDSNLNTLLFTASPAVDTIILRKTTGVQPIDGPGTLNWTQFKQNGTGGTIYIPENLYIHLGDGSSMDYKAATNWSTFDAYGTITWEKLEDSPYAIPGWGYGLLGFYEVGDSSRYEAIENVPSHINSSVDSELVAYTHTLGNAQMAGVSSGGTIPSNFYNGYTNNGRFTLGIYSNNAFLSNTDTITLEYSIAVNTDNVSVRTNISGCVKNGINNAATSNTVGLELYGFNKNASSLQTTGANRMFMYKVVELHSDNTYNVYINGQLEGSNQTYNNISTMNFINIGLNSDGCLGPVAIYDRALSSDEIADHYQFYVDNYMVGQTAYDSSGNFLGGYISGKPYDITWSEDGYTIDDSTGEAVSGSSGYRVTNFLRCYGASTIKQVGSAGGYLYFYDEDKEFIGRVGTTGSNATALINPFPAPVPLGAHYVRMTSTSYSTASLTPYKYEKLDSTVETYDLDTFYNVSFTSTADPIVNDERCDYVYCYGATKLQTSMYARSWVYFLDEDKQAISNSIRQGNYTEIDIPEGTYYLQIYPNGSWSGTEMNNPNPWIMFTA